MFKKVLILVLFTCFLSLESCGTILKAKYGKTPVTKKLDWGIVALDTMGTFFYIVPGLTALSIDYATGALFVPRITQK